MADVMEAQSASPYRERRERVQPPSPGGGDRRGFGGLAVAKGLAKAPVDVEIVDASNFHLFQPLLYQVATAGLDADDVAYAVRGVFTGQHNVTVHMALVTASISTPGR